MTLTVPIRLVDDHEVVASSVADRLGAHLGLEVEVVHPDELRGPLGHPGLTGLGRHASVYRPGPWFTA